MCDSTPLIAPCALLTGATGLLGRQINATFTRAGWATLGTGFSRADTSRRIYRLDLCDEEAVAEVLDEELYASEFSGGHLPAGINLS